MCDKVLHTLDRTSLDTAAGRFSVFFGQTAAKLTNLQDAEGDRSLKICIPIKNLERIPVAVDGLLNLPAVVSNVADTL